MCIRDRASKMIQDINHNNILQLSSQIIDLIKNNKIPIKMALYLIDNFSKIRIADLELFAELYKKISNEFSLIIKPENDKLALLLYNNGLKFKNFDPKLKQDENQNMNQIRQSPDLIAERIYFGNFDGAANLLSNGANINATYNLLHFISINIL